MKHFPLFLSIALFFCACSNFSAGSYPYAEIYTVNLDADTVIARLQFLKKQDSSLVPPIQLHLEDGKTDSAGYWHYFYFLHQNKKQIFFAWVRPAEKGIANLAFVSVSDGLRVGHWKDVNKDFAAHENDVLKQDFEHMILLKITTSNGK